MENIPTARQLRRPKGFVSSINTNHLHLRNPWVTALWSVIFPGFGHISLGSYVKGFLLVIWELFINQNAKINTAILYAFTGRFEQSAQILDKKWALLYCGVFVYGIWDSYRSTVDLNKFTLIAAHEKSPILPFAINHVEINYLDKRNPWVSFVWSLIMPGMGHLYTHRLPTGFIVLVWWIMITAFSHLLEAVIFSMTGQFVLATQIVDPQWLLFMPSLYGFVAYDAYANTVEYNKLFEEEQNRFLEDNYKDKSFPMPLLNLVTRSDLMYIVANFENSLHLELAIIGLEKNGVPRNKILAVPLTSEKNEMVFDTINKADGISNMDNAMIIGSAGMVLGTIYGFVLYWGPIIWGFMGLVIGIFIGFMIDKIPKKKSSAKRGTAGASSQKGTNSVVLLVNCRSEESKEIKNTLMEYCALGVGKMGNYVNGGGNVC